jgi:putative spermidine/putrescine transport system permease protein
VLFFLYFPFAVILLYAFVTEDSAGQQQTLPIWILDQLTRPRQRPVINVVAIFVVALTFIPILFANWLTQGSGSGR